MSFTPAPEPTAAQIETVAEITMLSYEVAADMIGSPSTQEITDAKWARTLTDITSWDDLVDEAGDVRRVGSIEFFENKIGTSRLAFRNKVRARYGYEPLVTETGETQTAIASLGWF